MRPFNRFLLIFAVAIMSAGLLSCASSEKKKESEAFYKIGMSQLITGNTQGAYVKFNEALNYNPRNKEAYNALGSVNMMMNDYEEAEKNFTEAIKIDSNYSEAYNNMCYLFYTTRQFHRAIGMCEKALANKLYETPEKAYYNIGRSYYKLGDMDRAIKAFKDAIKRFPNFFQAYYGVALAYNQQGAYGRAAESIGYAVGFDPRFLGNKAKAEKVFRDNRGTSEDPFEIDQLIEILHY